MKSPVKALASMKWWWWLIIIIIIIIIILAEANKQTGGDIGA
jgi:hypothetical protein